MLPADFLIDLHDALQVFRLSYVVDPGRPGGKAQRACHWAGRRSGIRGRSGCLGWVAVEYSATPINNFTRSDGLTIVFARAQCHMCATTVRGPPWHGVLCCSRFCQHHRARKVRRKVLAAYSTGIPRRRLALRPLHARCRRSISASARFSFKIMASVRSIFESDVFPAGSASRFPSPGGELADYRLSSGTLIGG